MLKPCPDMNLCGAKAPIPISTAYAALQRRTSTFNYLRGAKAPFLHENGERNRRSKTRGQRLHVRHRSRRANPEIQPGLPWQIRSTQMGRNFQR